MTSHRSDVVLVKSNPERITRKLSYRKDDRAMRPILYECLKIFWSP